MSDWLLEVRLFTVRPGTREEWHRISREGTIPLMGRCGITVVAHGPCLNDDNGYYLIRAFRDEQERIELSQSFYATEEFAREYEKPLAEMMTGYQTAVIPVPREAIEEFAKRITG
ncbi:NIPSNAP family protein [Microbispora rosea subsp. aerata]|nr:NIPSNAP family protein [Microbispora rosea]GGO10678.1 NIPSNAP family protein [Microbispora rosea subsp. aerata]GIH53673.1 NIPSNAP family protein [Microbispora rosea subsp. aerata]GLJ81666.1 NIPSNAP family protein [Microbispora rosea subsp. aerata]